MPITRASLAAALTLLSAAAHPASPMAPAHSGNLLHFFTVQDHLLLLLGSIGVAACALHRLLGHRAKNRNR